MAKKGKKSGKTCASSRNCFKNRWGKSQHECRQKNGRWKSGNCK